LQYTTPGAGTWAFELLINIAADATASANGFLAGVYAANQTGPSNANRYVANGSINATAKTLIQQNINFAIGVANNWGATVVGGSVDWMRVSGSVSTSAAGIIGFQWSELTTGTGNLTVQIGSYMILTQLSP